MIIKIARVSNQMHRKFLLTYGAHSEKQCREKLHNEVLRPKIQQLYEAKMKSVVKLLSDIPGNMDKQNG